MTMTETPRFETDQEAIEAGADLEEIPATKADIARLEGKIDNILTAFEELGNQFEGAVSGFLEGPMGKLMGKLMGKPKEDEVEADGDGET